MSLLEEYIYLQTLVLLIKMGWNSLKSNGEIENMDAKEFQRVYDGLSKEFIDMYSLKIVDGDIYTFKPATIGLSIKNLKEVENGSNTISFRNSVGCVTLFKNVEQQIITFYDFRE